jgi:hypothetical protein
MKFVLVELNSERRHYFSSTDAMKKYITDTADKDNCGVFRVWQKGDYQYFDCGPRSFMTSVKIFPLGE